jgi:hypothetical protein
LIYLEQRFHELAREYETVHNEVVKQREIESQLRNENEQLSSLKFLSFKLKPKFFNFLTEATSNDIEQQLTTIRQNEQQLHAKLVCFAG